MITIECQKCPTTQEATVYAGKINIIDLIDWECDAGKWYCPLHWQCNY